MSDAAYGLWPLVFLNTALFVMFAFSFFRPRTQRDWRVMGGYSAFLLALLTAMYGIPLTMYLLGSWLGSRFPLLDDTHGGGDLWNDVIGWSGNPHVSPFHLASYVFIGGGFWLIAAAWQVLHEAARTRPLAITGPYRWVPHPQYVGSLGVMTGFLLHDVATSFGRDWAAYANRTPSFLPSLRSEPRIPAGGP